MFKYSAAAGGFFRIDLHGDAIPADAVDVSDEEHDALLAGQQQGKAIVAGEGGRPMLVDPPPPTREILVGRLRYAVQRVLDVEARAQGFRSIGDAISYADEPAVPSFQQKAQALRAWRSLVWDAVNAQVELEQLPSAEELLAALPAAPAR